MDVIGLAWGGTRDLRNLELVDKLGLTYRDRR